MTAAKQGEFANCMFVVCHGEDEDTKSGLRQKGNLAEGRVSRPAVAHGAGCKKVAQLCPPVGPPPTEEAVVWCLLDLAVRGRGSGTLKTSLWYM